MRARRHRLTSRKFLVTLLGAGAFIAVKQYPEAVAVISTFLVGQTYLDSRATP